MIIDEELRCELESALLPADLSLAHEEAKIKMTKKLEAFIERMEVLTDGE